MTDFVNPVSYDRSQIATGIVHFGVGNFHRSHQAMYLDRLLRDPATFEVAKDWGICGVGVLPGDQRMREVLRAQDFEYTLIERCPDGSTPATRIASIVDYLYAPHDLDAVLKRLADPATKIVSLTITEGGYNINDVTGQFDETNPAILADIQPGAAPSTVFGIIVAGLSRRRARGVPPFTVMSCDNVEGNGNVARRSITSFAELVNPGLASWIEKNVSFPNSMVDRITPVTTTDDVAWTLATFAIEDAWPVLSEDFVQWVLEDDFPLGRPPWEAVGVQLVQDVRPYELMKLRLLNASHQALAYLGLLSGYEFAHEAATDPVIAGLVRNYMDLEATPTLDPVPGVDLQEYKAKLLARFANPYVRDTLSRLATDASDRIPKFLVPVIRAQRAAGQRVPMSACIVAGWARYAEQRVAGAPLPFFDRQEHSVRIAVQREAEIPGEFLRNSDWFGALADDPEFVSEFLTVLTAFRAVQDPRMVVEGLLRR